MILLSRILRRLPAVQRLEKECARLHAEHNSALLRARAISAKMGVLDAQVRMMQDERVKEAEKVKNLTVDHQRTATQLRLKSEACDALTKEKDALVAERGALTAQRDEAIHQRNQLARELEGALHAAAPACGIGFGILDVDLPGSAAVCKPAGSQVDDAPGGVPLTMRHTGIPN